MAAGNTLTNPPALLLAAVAIADHRIRVAIGGGVGTWIQTSPHTVTLTVRVGDDVLVRSYHGSMVPVESDVLAVAGEISAWFIVRVRAEVA